MKYYAVIDTNVLVSAMLKHHSVPGSIIDLAFDGPIVPVLNNAIEKEYREVLSRPKFHLPSDLVEDILSSFHQRGLYVDAEELDLELPDPKDRVFYEVVMEERKEEDAYLVTGNIKHFPERPYVVTPRQMLNIILEDQETYQADP
jgi:putative PIN family toxin of toxin-antitoxin system